MKNYKYIIKKFINLLFILLKYTILYILYVSVYFFDSYQYPFIII